jgi:hypothetical protein
MQVPPKKSPATVSKHWPSGRLFFCVYFSVDSSLLSEQTLRESPLRRAGFTRSEVQHPLRRRAPIPERTQLTTKTARASTGPRTQGAES